MLGLGLLIILCMFYSPRRIQRLSFWANQWRDRGAVVFLGDSIIAGWPDLSGAFPGCKVANRALRGDGTREVLNRLKTEVLPLKPSGLVLLIGTNDLNDGAEPEAVLENVTAIISAVRNRFPAVWTIVCTLPPRGPVPGRFPEKILKFNQGLKTAFGASPQVMVFDTWSLFADAYGQPRPDEFPDGLHPSPVAYRKWASALQPLLNPTTAHSTASTNR